MATSRLRRHFALLGAIGILALPACGGGEKKEAGKEAATTAPPATQPESTTTTAAGPDLSPKEVALETPITAGNFTVTFHGVTIPYQVPESSIFRPIPGTLLATVDTEVKNNGAAVEEFQANMLALDSTNRIFPLVSSSVQPEPPRGQIAPGTGKRGLYVIQLLEGAQAPGLRLVFAPDEKKEPAYVLPLVAGGTPPAAPSAATPDPAKTYAKDEAVQVGWGAIVVHGVTNPAQPDDPKWDAPEAGQHLVVADVEVFNTTKQHHNAFDFDVKIKDAMNQSFSTTTKHTAANKIAERGVDNTIIAGLGFRGPVTFMVPDAGGNGPLTLLIQFKGEPAVMFALA
jgi:hypothetical protein